MKQTLSGHAASTGFRYNTRAGIVRTAAVALSALLLSMPHASIAAGKGAITTLPAVSMVKLDGSPLSTADWRGKPAVVNVWATWCPPCRTEMPSLQRLGEVLESSGIRVVALSVDSDQNLVREFVLKYGIRLPVGIATTPRQAMASLGAMALPLTLYVGADGRVLGQHFGQRDWVEDAAVREVKQNLLTPTPSNP